MKRISNNNEKRKKMNSCPETAGEWPFSAITLLYPLGSLPQSYKPLEWKTHTS